MHQQLRSMWCEMSDYFANVVNVKPARPADSTDLHATPYSGQRPHSTSLITMSASPILLVDTEISRRRVGVPVKRISVFPLFKRSQFVATQVSTSSTQASS